jgi:hypothetical protein
LSNAYAEYLTREPPARDGRASEPDRAACAPEKPREEIVLPWPKWSARRTSSERQPETSDT